MRAKLVRRPCPFIPEQLWQLYVLQQLGLLEIAQLAAQVAGWEKPPTQIVVERWLKEAGVPKRTHEEVIRLRKNRLRCKGLTKKNLPCGESPLRGYSYCWDHWSQAPPDSPEQALMARAVHVAAQIKQELRQRQEQQVPGHLSKSSRDTYMKTLQDRITDTPKIALELAAIALLPEKEARTNIARLVAWFEAQGGEPFRAVDFPLFNFEEFEALAASAAEGRTRRHWTNDLQTQRRIHHVPDWPHQIELGVTVDDQDFLDIAGLERLTDEQDADTCYALMYVSWLLTPPSAMSPNTFAGGWIDLDDVASKIWPPPRSTKERLENRRRIYCMLRFGDRAEIKGKRTSTYYDQETGQEIPTTINGPIWRIMDSEEPKDQKDKTLSLFPGAEVALRYQLVASEDWTRLCQDPRFAQYLPLGELLGSIPGNQPGGAWARAFGMTLASFWRRYPLETLDGTLRITCRELLLRYEPKTAAPLEILNGPNPERAISYRCAAFVILCENGFLAAEGDVDFVRKSSLDKITKRIRDSLPRYHWKDAWLDQALDLRPGPKMRPAVQAVADSLLALQQHQLPPVKRRGRPRKNPVQ